MGANVLIVDDSTTMRRMIKRTLEISGLDVGEVLEAANGIEALARMAEHTVHAVLLDINMPVMSGVRLVERIRDDPRLKNIPVVIASTEGSETRIQQLVAAGARGFVRKPFHPEQIRDVLAPILGVSTPAASASDDEMAF
ncbi:MAG: response regulator [Phycisphaerae bacterium]|jgi:two-component system chemotaxis response regulator CheY